MALVSTGQITISDLNDVNIQTVPPSSPVLDQLWLDTLTVPNQLKRWDGTVWVNVTPTTPQEVGAYPSEDGTALAGRMDAAELKITPGAITAAVEANTTALATKAEVNLSAGELSVKLSSLHDGKMLYTDPTFRVGANGTSRYNNADDGTVSYVRVAASADCPTTSAYMMRCTNTGTTARPGGGGFYFATQSRANSVFITRIIAKIPVGKTLSFGSNATGTGWSGGWLTPNAGTGKFETYVFRLVCGSTGAFSSTNFFYILETGPNDWSIAYATVYDATEQEDTMEVGILKANRDGLWVGKQGQTVETNVAYDGVRIKDGSTEVASFTDAGAVIDNLQALEVTGNLINLNPGGTYYVGPTQPYNTVTEILNSFGNKKYLTGDLTFRIYGSVLDYIYLNGFSGPGRIYLTFVSGAILSGGIKSVNTTCPLLITGTGVIKGIVALPVVHCYGPGLIYHQNVVVDGNNVGTGIDGLRAEMGGKIVASAYDSTRLTGYSMCAVEGGEIHALSCKGSGNTGGAIYIREARVAVRGTIPQGTVNNNGQYETNGTNTPTASAYAPPAQTDQTFTGVYSPTQINTYSYEYGAISSHYGTTAAQNRWDSSTGMFRGQIQFGADLYNYIQDRKAGTTPTVQIRLRRKNSTHGTSSAVTPRPYNFTPTAGFTGATRGGWSGWATIPYTLITASGFQFQFYDNTTGYSYAIWDAAEVKVTKVKTV